jgi:rhombotail lipoprotein
MKHGRGRFGVALSMALSTSIGVAGCGSAPAQIAEANAPASAPAAPVLAKSLFLSSGAITEDDLQKVLSTGIDLAFPARVGVLPVAKPFDPNADVSISLRTVASRDLARSLEKTPAFSQVSNISTDLPTQGGIDGLRAIAARYRLRYIVLYSERFEDETHVNGWAALYPTILGIFITPSVTVESRGIAEADLVDVRTGTILASSIQPLHVDSSTFVVGAGRHHRDLQHEAAEVAAPELAKDLAMQTNALVAFAEEARASRPASRYLPPPVDLDVPILGPKPNDRP